MDLSQYYAAGDLLKPVLDAPWVTIERYSGPRRPYWACSLVHWLTGPENGNQHNAFVDLVELSGQRLDPTQARIAYTWAGRAEGEAAPLTKLDKRRPEVAGNLPIWPGQVVTLWIQSPLDLGDDIASDRVAGLCTAGLSQFETPPATGRGREHQSYLCLFTKVLSRVEPGGPAPELTLQSLYAQVQRIEADVRALQAAGRLSR